MDWQGSTGYARKMNIQEYPVYTIFIEYSLFRAENWIIIQNICVHNALINLHNRAIFCAIYHWTLAANGGIIHTVDMGTLKISDGRAPVPNFGIGKIPISATIVDYQLLTSYRLKPYKNNLLKQGESLPIFKKQPFSVSVLSERKRLYKIVL